MAIFPFVTHVYYTIKHAPFLDTEFYIYLLVCIILPLGIIWIKNDKAITK